MKSVRITSIEIARDRGYEIPQEEKDLIYKGQSLPEIYGDKYLDFKKTTSKNGLTFQVYLSEELRKKRIPNMDFKNSQLYHLHEDKLGIFNISFLNVSVSRFIKEIIDNFSIDNVIIIVENKNVSMSVAKIIDEINNLTIFEHNELGFNPSINIYVPRYSLPDKVTLQNFLKSRNFRTEGMIRRPKDDIIIRYYGYKPGTILIENYPELNLRNSIIDQEILFVKVI